GQMIIAAHFDPELYPLVADQLATPPDDSVQGGSGAGVLLAAWASEETRREIHVRARWNTRRGPCRACFTIRAPAPSRSISSTPSRLPARSTTPPGATRPRLRWRRR